MADRFGVTHARASLVTQSVPGRAIHPLSVDVISARRAAILAPFIGALAAVGQAPLGWEKLSLVGFALLIWLVAGAPRARVAFLRGWLAGIGYFGATLFWIVEPFLVDVARTGWMAPFALLFTATGFALFWGAGSAVGLRIARTPARRAVSVALALSLAEVLRGHILTGFPWALPAYIWIDRPLGQWLAWVGPYGLTTLTLLAVAGLGTAPLAGRGKIFVVLTVALPILALELSGLTRLRALPLEQPDRPIVRLIQPNAPQHQKWDPAMIPVFFERAEAATAAPAETPPALVVWPETALPTFLDLAENARTRIRAAAGDAEVVVGTLRRDATGIFNSLAVIGPDGAASQIYDKHHLVPFGEFIPLEALARHIGLGALAAQGGALSAGPGPKLIDLGPLGTALPLICYEAIFPANARTGQRPDLLLQITNDAWFGEYAGPFQHLAQARARAIEQGLPLIRAANTGVSAVVAPSGDVVASLGLGQQGHLDARLPAPLAPTLYSRFNDWPTIILILLGLLFVAIPKRKS